MASLRCMELKGAVGLEVKRFGVVGGEKKEGSVEGYRVPGPGKRKLREVMGMNLRLVCS